MTANQNSNRNDHKIMDDDSQQLPHLFQRPIDYQPPPTSTPISAERHSMPIGVLDLTFTLSPTKTTTNSITTSSFTDFDNPDDHKTTRHDSTLQRVHRVCLIDDAQHDEQLRRVLEEKFSLQEVLSSDNGHEYMHMSDVVFICCDFFSSEFKYLYSSGCHILGPTIVYEAAAAGRQLPLPRKNRPLYCYSMRDVVFCTSGLHTKVIKKYVDLVHFMGGSARAQWSPCTTHLVSITTQSEKYRQFVSMGKTVLQPSWIDECWNRRDILHSSALNPTLINEHRLPSFFGLKMILYGFDDSESEHMSEHARKFGGEIITMEDDEKATHLVVNFIDGKNIPGKPNEHCHVVTAEWFWISIHLDCCANESLYPAYNRQNQLHNNRKRTAPSSTQLEPIFNNRQSNLRKSADSLSRETLENSADASGTLLEHIFSSDDIEALGGSPVKTDKRRQVCLELLQTEKNYCDVLRTIVNTFKDPLEQMLTKEPLLSSGEIAIIFGKFPPLLNVHEKICQQLINLISHWREDRTIGAIWITYAEELEKVYPSFVNTFDSAKQKLKECDQSKPKFHAFLKACESRPECHRQTLNELLIRPVQRLASVQLLLKDILKKTDKSNPDYDQLERAIKATDRILRHINETKRQTEDRVRIFEIFNDIEYLPPELISSQRAYVAEIDAINLDCHVAPRKRMLLTLYLFNDILEITKIRNRSRIGLNHQRNNASTLMNSTGYIGLNNTPSASSHKKTHKHIARVSLTAVRQIDDVVGDDDAQGIFVLTLRDENGDDQWSLQIADHVSDEQKHAFLAALAHHIFVLCGRDIAVNAFDLNDASTSMRTPERVQALQSALKHNRSTLRRNHSLISTKQPLLRRAVSTISIGLTRTLTRSRLPRM